MAKSWSSVEFSAPDPVVAYCDTCGAGLPEHTCCGDHPEVGTTPVVLPTRYRWVVEIEIDPTMVADGLDLTDPRDLHDALTRAFPYTRMSEIGVRVLCTPDLDAIAREQGYKSAAHKRSRER